MIELINVEKKYGMMGTGQTGLYYESVTIPSGEIVGILGANGSGKTTMLKAIMGIGELQSGEIRIEGCPVGEQYDKMSFITEEGSFLPNMTPDQYADFIIDFFPRFDRQHYGKLLKFFEIDPYAPIRTFSKGQKSKVEFSAGFSKRARYILMDEPFLGKDMFTRRNLLKLMISSLSDNETVLISTHLIEEIENVIDRAIILSYGRIKADFYMDDLRQEGKNLADVMSEISGYNEDRMKQIFKSRE